nr:retrotransposon-related protein [Tanacetum cinerariifolium]
SGPVNVIARRAINEISEFSGETETPKYKKVGAMVAEMEASNDQDGYYDSLSCLRDSWRIREDKIRVLNESIVAAKEKISHFHNGPTGGHSGIQATTKRMGALMYWKKMRNQIKQHIRQCDTCQRYKPELVPYPGLLQPLPILTSVWAEISIDFIDGLPMSKERTVIMVIVDRLSKYSHFVPLTYPYTAIQVAQSFLDTIYRLHGLPKIITTPYHVVYGQAPPDHITYTKGDSLVDDVDRYLSAREAAIDLLKFHIKRSQNRMKSLADKHSSDREFKE